MLTLYHAPNSRSSTIVALIEELGLQSKVTITEVSVRRADGSGGPDPRNPHPEGKVPYLTSGTDHVFERAAIVAFLTDLVPDHPMGRAVGDPQRGAYLSWLAYYQGVVEPVLVLHMAGVAHPVLSATLRDLDHVTSRLSATLDTQPYLLGDRYSAVDLLLASPFHWMPDIAPSGSSLADWIARCAARPSVAAIAKRELALLAN